MTFKSNEIILKETIDKTNDTLESITERLLTLYFKQDKLLNKLDNANAIIKLMYNVTTYFPPYRNLKQPNAVNMLYNELLEYCNIFSVSIIDDHLIYNLLEENTLVPEKDAKAYLKKALSDSVRIIDVRR